MALNLSDAEAKCHMECSCDYLFPRVWAKKMQDQVKATEAAFTRNNFCKPVYV